MVLEDVLRLKSGRLGTEDGVEDGATLASGLVGTEELVAEGPRIWFTLGAGEFFRETSERFGTSAEAVESVDALGTSTDAGFDNCWATELEPSLAAASVILASSISPSSTSSFPEAVLIIFGTPFVLEVNVSVCGKISNGLQTYAEREVGWKSGAFGFSVLAASPSRRGVDGLADVDLTPLGAAPPSVYIMSDSV